MILAQRAAWKQVKFPSGDRLSLPGPGEAVGLLVTAVASFSADEAPRHPQQVVWPDETPLDEPSGDSEHAEVEGSEPLVSSLASRFSRLSKGAKICLVLSALLHAGVFAALLKTPAPEMDEALMEGSTVVAVTVFGDAPADMLAAGTDKPLEQPITEIRPEEVVPEPEEVVRNWPEPVIQPEPVVRTEPVVKPEPAVKPVEQRIEPAPEKPVEPIVAEPAKTEDILAATGPADPKIAQPVATTPTSTEPVEEDPAPVIDNVPVPVARPEPVVRTAEREKPVVKKQTAKPVGKTKPKTEKKPRQNSGSGGKNEANAKKGATEAKDSGAATQNASKGGKATAENGNASITNYVGKVNRMLARAKKKARASGRGSVTVAFTITANGSVRGVSVVANSGAAALEAAAIALIKKAGPFPPIPAESGKSQWPMQVTVDFRG